MDKIIYGVPCDRVKQLCEAYKDGRCVVLPCKVGDTVYKLGRFYCKICEGFHYRILELYFTIDMIPYTGKTIFITREAAEKALEKTGGKI